MQRYDFSAKNRTTTSLFFKEIHAVLSRLMPRKRTKKHRLGGETISLEGQFMLF